MADALTNVRTDRSAAERRIAALEVKRAKQLVASDDISLVDQIDTAIETERRAIRILVQREAALARADRQQARKDREADRAAALKVIAPLLDKRVALATELEQALKNVVGLYEQINETQQLKKAWPFSAPERFPWQLYDLGADCLRTLRDNGGYALLPAAVRQAIAQGGSGFTQAPADGPRGPDDLPGKVAANAALILKSLSTLNIHPPEPTDEADTDVRAA